jgi:hypothetical protein
VLSIFFSLIWALDEIGEEEAFGMEFGNRLGYRRDFSVPLAECPRFRA